MIPAEHRVTVTIGDDEIPVISGSLRQDTTRAPAITANLTVPATPELLALDPQRELIWATITVTVSRKRFYRVRHLASLIPGMTALSDFTSAYLGKKVSDVTTSAADETTSWTLQLRTVREHWADGTIDLTLKSSEVLLIDFIQPGGYSGSGPGFTVAEYQRDLPTTSILAAAQKLVGTVGLDPIVTAASAASSTITDQQKRWRRGVSAWEQLQLILRDKTLLARPDGTTIKLIAENVAAVHEVTLTDGPGGTIIDGGQVIDRDAADFAHVMVSGRQPAAVYEASLDDVGRDYLGGTSVIAKGQASPFPKVSPPFKMIRTRSDTYRGWGDWIAPTATAYHRGRGWDILAVADYTIEPGTLAHVTAEGTSFNARVRGVEHTWPANTTRLDTVESFNTNRADQMLLSDWWS